LFALRAVGPDAVDGDADFELGWFVLVALEHDQLTVR
jgi:hypothetical protein